MNYQEKQDRIATLRKLLNTVNTKEEYDSVLFELESLEEVDQYTVEVTCQNCGKQKTYHLEKGLSVEDALDQKPCTFCECSVVIKRERR